MKPCLLISACLVGIPCRYDGRSKEMEGIHQALQAYTLVPFCPEVAGGLAVPRPKSERRGDQVVTELGQDVSSAFLLGAQEALTLCQALGIRQALLKEGSPSCGVHWTYDGSFRGQKVARPGLTSQVLTGAGIHVRSSEDGLQNL